MTSLLVLGGTRFVGRAVVADALARGWDVTVLNRGSGGPAGVRALRADRSQPGDLSHALAGTDGWDLVVDTWSGRADAVAEAAAALGHRCGCYAYVSSVSVYAWPWPMGIDESAPTVAAGAEENPDEDPDDYAVRKRRSELAVLDAVGGDAAILARAGLILGPYEDVGRLPWWLDRLARGGRVLAPGPHERPLQYIDARDLAAWLLDSAHAGHRGAANAVGPAGSTTMGALLETAAQVTGGRADLQWVTPEQVERTGLEPWTQLPLWTPPTGELASIHAIATDRARAWGLTVRPMEQTVADTWAWLQRDGLPQSVSDGAVGHDAAAEQAAWAALGDPS